MRCHYEIITWESKASAANNSIFPRHTLSRTGGFRGYGGMPQKGARQVPAPVSRRRTGRRWCGGRPSHLPGHHRRRSKCPDARKNQNERRHFCIATPQPQWPLKTRRRSASHLSQWALFMLRVRSETPLYSSVAFWSFSDYSSGIPGTFATRDSFITSFARTKLTHATLL